MTRLPEKRLPIIRRTRDLVEVRPPGRDLVYVDDFDEFVVYRYGRCWLHVEQMNKTDFYLGIYGSAKRRVHLSIRLGRKGTGDVEVVTHENDLERKP